MPKVFSPEEKERFIKGLTNSEIWWGEDEVFIEAIQENSSGIQESIRKKIGTTVAEQIIECLEGTTVHLSFKNGSVCIDFYLSDAFSEEVFSMDLATAFTDMFTFQGETMEHLLALSKLRLIIESREALLNAALKEEETD